MSSSVPITDRVTALSDEQTVTTLALVLERQGLTVDPFTQAEEEAHLREALAQPEITDSVEPTPGATRRLIAQAMQIAPRADREPTLLLATGALVLLAFRTDIDLAHEPGKGWKFRFRTKGLSDSTIGKLLGQLLGNFLNPGA